MCVVGGGGADGMRAGKEGLMDMTGGIIDGGGCAVVAYGVWL